MIDPRIRKAVEEALREMIEGKREMEHFSLVAIEFNEKFHITVLNKPVVYSWFKQLKLKIEEEHMIQKKEMEAVGRGEEKPLAKEVQAQLVQQDAESKMNLETFRSDGYTWVKLGVIGILATRVKVVKAMFLNLIGKPEYGVCKAKFQGIEQPVKVSEKWVKSASPMQGEIFNILLDEIDFTGWRLERPEEYSAAVPPYQETFMMRRDFWAKLEEMYRKGYDDAMKIEHFTIPCSRCGEPLYLSSKSQKWIDKIKPKLESTFSKWYHTKCPIKQNK
jgi:hypothetical protein